MSTAQLTGARPARVPGPGGRAAAAALESSWRGLIPLAALLAAVAYAAFAHGAASFPYETRLQIGLAAVAVLGCGWWLFGSLRPRAPRRAWAGVALLIAFAAWSGLSLAWSVAPDRTWLELNRNLSYAVVVLTAVAAGSAHPRALSRLAVGYLGVAVLIALYASGGKLAPGLHVSGLFSLDHTADVTRLRAPLDYWNALGIVLAIAVPTALRIAVDETRGRRVRLAALAAANLLVVTIGMTYSRGTLLSLFAALGVSLWLGGARLRSLLWLGMAVVAAAPPLAYAFTTPALTRNGAPLALRETAGVVLAGVLAISLLALLAFAVAVIALERRIPASPERSRRIGRGLVYGVGVFVALAFIGLLQSPRGLTGTLSHDWHQFIRVRQENQYDPGRLLSTNGSNRWVWWQEALGAWSDHPLNGWGAGSFPVTHLLYRRNTLNVDQPHSVPLQFLAEDGLVGAAAALGGLGLLLGVGLRFARRLEAGRERGLAAALAAGALAFVLHTFLDWDWDIPGATLPALALLGGLAGAAGRREDGVEPALPDTTGPRAAGLAGIGLLGCAFALSALLPDLANGKSNGAYVRAGNGTPGELRAAAAEADLAARLDPLSDDPLVAGAAIAERAGDIDRAHADLLGAVEREPYDARAWYELSRIQALRRDRTGIAQATARALALDPANPGALSLASRAEAFRTPPGASATATGTPLPPAPAAAVAPSG